MNAAHTLVETLLSTEAAPPATSPIKVTATLTFPTEYTVVATYRGRQAAKASVKLVRTNQLRMAGIMVDEEFRRRGIASAIYTHMEKLTGRTFVKGLKPTADGSALWNSPKRQFGPNPPTTNA